LGRLATSALPVLFPYLGLSCILGTDSPALLASVFSPLLVLTIAWVLLLLRVIIRSERARFL